MQIVVVRHGHAEPKKTWTGADSDRPLVARGRRQANGLTRVVGSPEPVRLVTSPAARCRETLEPYAAETDLTIEHSQALAPDAGSASLDLVKQLIAENVSPVVLCTHREVINEMLPKLAKSAGYKLVHRLPGAKGG